MQRLWAPWRMEFIRTVGSDDECFLCRAARGEEPEESIVIRREEHAFCLLNRYPYSNGHLLICPYRHVADVEEMSDAELLGAMTMLREAKRALQRSVGAQGYNVGINFGRAAGAGLEEHMHLHIVPRWIGDSNFMTVLGDTKVIPQSLADVAELLRLNWDAPAGEAK